MNLPDEFDPLLNLAECIGHKGVTEEVAAANRARGRGPRKPRPPVRGEVPMAASTWWAGIRKGIYPPPIKIGPRKCVWRRSEVRAIAKREAR